jgi:hypothetical protein
MINWEDWEIEEIDKDDKKNILICRNGITLYAGFLNYDDENKLVFILPHIQKKYSFKLYFYNPKSNENFNIIRFNNNKKKTKTLFVLKEKYNAYILGIDINKNDILKNKTKYVNFFKE